MAERPLMVIDLTQAHRIAPDDLVQALRVQRRLPWNRTAYLAQCARLDDLALPPQMCVTRLLHKVQVRWEIRG